MIGPQLDTHQPVTIFHLAATSSVSLSVADPLGDFDRVLPGTARLLHCVSQQTPSAKVVYFSSAAVYGNPTRLPVSESSSINPMSPYGIHKHVSEQLLFAYACCYGLTSASLRIFSAYGEGLRKQLFYDLDRKLCLSERNNLDSVEMLGDGTESRDFIHGSDVAQAALIVANHKLPLGLSIFNVASGCETTIAEAARKYMKLRGIEKFLNFRGIARTGDPSNWCADTSRIRALGFNPVVSLDAGLQSYASWATSNAENE